MSEGQSIAAATAAIGGAPAPVLLLDACALRVVDDRPPASKGKSEYKDCEIVEHYLALAKALRAAGFAEPCILVSSNTRDYRVLGPTADAAFAAELRTAGLSFVTDIVWARSQSGGHTSWRAR